MPRGPRLDVPGLVYHVISRGNERRKIFKDIKDCRYFLNRLAFLAGEEAVKVYAFCLMPNHIHLLIKPLNTSLASFMRRLLTSYATYFNKRHKRSGHLFQNRYTSFTVQHGTYFLELIRYIHLNPVKAGIVDSLHNLSVWPLTGHTSLMGYTTYKWFEEDETLCLFAKKKNIARKLLFKFMQEGLIEKDKASLDKEGDRQSGIMITHQGSEWESAIEKQIVGDSKFAEWVLEILEKRSNGSRSETALEGLLERVASFYDLAVPELCSGSKRSEVVKARAAAIYLGSRQLFIPPKMLAQVLGVGVTTVYETLRIGKGKKESQGICLDNENL